MVKLEVLKQKIIQQTGKTKEEVDHLIDTKKEELEFLINDLAAAHIIAKDLHVDINKPLIKDKHLQGLKQICFDTFVRELQKEPDVSQNLLEKNIDNGNMLEYIVAHIDDMYDVCLEHTHKREEL